MLRQCDMYIQNILSLFISSHLQTTCSACLGHGGLVSLGLPVSLVPLREVARQPPLDVLQPGLHHGVALREVSDPPLQLLVLHPEPRVPGNLGRQGDENVELKRFFKTENR